MLRPLDHEACSEHFHAAAFPFRPFKKGRLELTETVHTLFDGGGPLRACCTS